jgi:hypothetical protein
MSDPLENPFAKIVYWVLVSMLIIVPVIVVIVVLASK